MKRLVAPLAVTAAVAAGGVAGALIGVPAISGAQEAEEQPDSSATDEARPRLGPRGGALDAAAEALGLEADDLLTQLRDGSTIAEIATAQGLDVNAVIDAMVADVLDDSERDEAEVREHITDLVNEGFAARGDGLGRRGGHGWHGRGLGLETAAEALGIETEALADALREGQTIAEVATEQGVDVDTVIDAMAAEARERIETFVNEGPQKPQAPEAAEETEDAEDDAS